MMLKERINKPFKEVTEEDLFDLRFKYVVNENPVLCYYRIINPKYEIKIDVWGEVYVRRKVCLSDYWSPWLKVVVLDYLHLLQVVEFYTDL